MYAKCQFEAVHIYDIRMTRHPLGYERVYLPLCEVADTPFHKQGGDVSYPNTHMFDIMVITLGVGPVK